MKKALKLEAAQKGQQQHGQTPPTEGFLQRVLARRGGTVSVGVDAVAHHRGHPEQTRATLEGPDLPCPAFLAHPRLLLERRNLLLQGQCGVLAGQGAVQAVAAATRVVEIGPRLQAYAGQTAVDAVSVTVITTRRQMIVVETVIIVCAVVVIVIRMLDAAHFCQGVLRKKGVQHVAHGEIDFALLLLW